MTIDQVITNLNIAHQMHYILRSYTWNSKWDIMCPWPNKHVTEKGMIYITNYILNSTDYPCDKLNCRMCPFLYQDGHCGVMDYNSHIYYRDLTQLKEIVTEYKNEYNKQLLLIAIERELQYG